MLQASAAVDAGPDVVCMLAEGGYFHGAAALINSLIRNGFIGHIAVGYRGTLPRWEGPVQPEPDVLLPVAEGVDVRFVSLDDPASRSWALANLKPQLMMRIVEELYPALRSIWYFDVDIVLTTAWSSFGRWIDAGAVLVLDLSETYMPANHVFRREWRALAERAGLGHRPVDGYFNSGCVGVRSDATELLRVWSRLLAQRAAEGAPMGRMVDRSDKPEYAKMDQDLLNAAVMASGMPYAVLGIEAMGAFPSAQVMAHAMVFDKPWARNYIRDAIIGFQPDQTHLAFWRFADGPIRSFAKSEWNARQRALRFARLFRHLKQRTVREW